MLVSEKGLVSSSDPKPNGVPRKRSCFRQWGDAKQAAHGTITAKPYFASCATLQRVGPYEVPTWKA